MSGKLKISGSLMKAMKLEKLMKLLKNKCQLYSSTIYIAKYIYIYI